MIFYRGITVNKSLRRKKLLGVIGGMGPLADTVFISRLRALTAADRDCEHIPILYDGNCIRPDRSDYLTGRTKSSPYGSLCRSMKLLERCGCDVIAMPCNTAHGWFNNLNKAKKHSTVMLNMVKETAYACEKRGLQTVCLLATEGTYRRDLYGGHFFRLGVDCVIPDRDLRSRIQTLIRKAKAGKAVSLTEIEDDLKKIRCDGFVLGCTELSLALENTKKTDIIYVDSLTALAEEAVSVFKKVKIKAE